MSTSISRDLPGVDLHEEATNPFITLTLDTMIAPYQIVTTRPPGITVGVRTVSNPPGSPAVLGQPITSLPQPVQDAIMEIRDYLLAQPYVFDGPPPPPDPIPDPLPVP